MTHETEATTATSTGPGAPRTQGRGKEFDRPRFLWLVTGLVLILMLTPIVTVAVYSFNAQNSLAVMDGWSLRWYRELAGDQDILASLRLSFWIALVAAVTATVLGTLLAFGLQRGRPAVARTGQSLIFLRLVSPETALGVALLLMFTQLGVELSLTTVVIGHVALCTAFVTVVVRSRLVAIAAEVEDAALDLGARPWQAIWLVVLPLLRPAIITSALLSFVLSFDNFITSYFTSGLGVAPLPVRIYSMIRFGVTPEINAIGILMLLLTVACVALAALLPRLFRRRSYLAEVSTK
ncbi:MULTISPECIES: ABC transporter permease [Streptomyces]|nr:MULTISPECIES: ABC transporter permease [Streptomyces]